MVRGSTKMETNKIQIISGAQPNTGEVDKDTVKVVKNTKGYNYEFKLVAKEGVDILKQVDYLQAEMEKRVSKWTFKKPEVC